MKKIFIKLLSGLFIASFLLTAVPQPSSATALMLYLKLVQMAQDVADSLPNDIMEDDKTVDLDKFKDKHGNTPKTKSSGEFKYGRWSIEKDTAGHLGYNGKEKKWKLNKSGERKASLDEDGVVLGK
ncbi:hypothetical protein [Paenibacillus thiaminolyticus]|uniref:Novel toxin 21 domain-containing protein n=1 Tax=Paenibacillus thiaminolyticus TaxID=49283 RepID=A0A3A3GCZ5_PANTH|nr:hypothetical protein [Paenibacillus thiaminolyticus]RJG20603.1 hypothetical protein DQX05_24445 [Paenibacillus thiaminolyticus]